MLELRGQHPASAPWAQRSCQARLLQCTRVVGCACVDQRAHLPTLCMYLQDIKTETVPLDGFNIRKAELEKRKNDDEVRAVHAVPAGLCCAAACRPAARGARTPGARVGARVGALAAPKAPCRPCARRCGPNASCNQRPGSPCPRRAPREALPLTRPLNPTYGVYDPHHTVPITRDPAGGGGLGAVRPM